MMTFEKAEMKNTKEIGNRKLVLTNYFKKVLPVYLIKYCNRYDIPLWYAYGVGQTESSHNSKAISHKNAYGRFQIKEVWLDNFLQIKKINKSKIDDVKTFLLNDKYNSYVWAYSVKVWRSIGYSYKEISQIWLFGESGFLDGRYSKRYERNIFRYEI